MALFIKFDGVDGESKDKDHKCWSDVISVSSAIHKPGSGATGQTRRRGTATVEDVSVAMEFDKATLKLEEGICTGKVYPKVELHFTATYGEARETFLKYELKNVAVSSLSVDGHGNADAVPTMMMSLNFEEMKKTYVEYDSAGKKKGNVEMTWKVEEGQK